MIPRAKKISKSFLQTTFDNLGVIKNDALFDPELIAEFEQTITKLKADQAWTKNDIVELFFKMIPAFGHKETGKYLDSKM